MSKLNIVKIVSDMCSFTGELNGGAVYTQEGDAIFFKAVLEGMEDFKPHVKVHEVYTLNANREFGEPFQVDKTEEYAKTLEDFINKRLKG